VDDTDAPVRFRISRLQARGTAQLMTSNLVPLHMCCKGDGRTSTGLKCRDWSDIS
jgi:hypothetical protein